MLALLFAPQPAPPSLEFINLALVLREVYPALNAAGPNDLVFWSETELYEYLDESQSRLARTCGVFVKRDTSVTSEANTGTYALPADHVSTVQADLGGVVLRARTVHELEALDALWPATVGEPAAFVQDLMGLGEIVLYPAPSAEYGAVALGLVERVLPPALSSSNGALAAPTCIQEYFVLSAIAAARGKQSKAEMPDVAAWLQKITGTMEQAMTEYWGGAT